MKLHMHASHTKQNSTGHKPYCERDALRNVASAYAIRVHV